MNTFQLISTTNNKWVFKGEMQMFSVFDFIALLDKDT
jgi:hypothetical protein